MGSPTSRFEVCLNQPGDEAGILKVLSERTFEGNLGIRPFRKPDLLSSYEKEGRPVVLVVVKDHQDHEIAGIGCCILRSAYINGYEQTTAYLAGMKLREKYRKWVSCIRESFQLIEAETRNEFPFYYTTILESNMPVSRMLEKQRRGMPLYEYQGFYQVHLIATGRRGRVRGNLLFSRDNVEGLEEFYQQELPKYQFAPPFSAVQHLAWQQCYYSLRTTSGEIIAACVVLNQQPYKQYQITHYDGMYRFLAKLPMQLLGYPALPKPEQDLNYACIGLLCIKGGYEHLAKDFLRQVAQDARDYDILMLGLYESHPLLPYVQKMRTYRYNNRFYNVRFENHPQYQLDGRPIMLETALL